MGIRYSSDMASYWLFRRASITAFGGVRSGSAAPWRFFVKTVESRTTPPVVLQRCSMTPILHLCTASAVVKKQKFKKRRPQSLQLVDQYHSSHLIRILDSEIKCALDSDLLHCDVDVPEGFPFKVQDIPGGRSIVLEREFRGEVIIVQVDMPTGAYAAAGDDDDDDDDGPVDEIDEADHESQPSIPLVVTVSKGNGSCLQFDARAFPGRILVNGLSFNNFSGNSEEDGRPAYKGLGLDFLYFNDKFQKAIHDYLESRGLTSSTANYLLEYTISKDAKEYLHWLKNLKKLIEQ